MANYKKMAKSARLEAGKLMTQKQVTACNTIIHTATVACGACGAIPIPIADAVPMTAAQITMVISLGKVFEKELTETAAKTILSAVAAPLVGRAVAGGVLKFVPVAGWAANVAVAALVTEVIGWTIANDFAKDYRKAYKLQREKEKAEEAVKKAVNEAEEAWVNNLDELSDPKDYM